MKKYKIIIIEDEKKIARFLELELKHEGYEVDLSYDGREGLEKINNGDFDLVLLDLMLPSLSGMEICRRVRKNSDIPIIMLTAKDQVMDKVMGLDLGAHDYITKPFAIEELLARMRGILRRNKTGDIQDNTLSIKGLSINTDIRQLTIDGESVDLTKTEYDLLVYLLKNKGLVLTRDQIIEEVWGYDYPGDTNIVDVYIRYLRSKIDDRNNQNYIHTVRGVGYVIKD
ncbi:DNA-binding response OmpR family regulator [Orenia metallireducens]|uniref:Stage 0 sporulation protein A homolog n=1 Tax=Orenia metallireducens TaxID=1413210 RepID=A0A285F4V8_9FIRM|nr:response regulator transcription factor [Orenia metallireducens]PRX34896.1 DNA-binding response OmpR family regulator [Orenia metallireducens]SNY06093.1 DNA-binding response regulator, OmpR family, contains REC and winged-helix (wHTH) domain [Orenia metallireducens]